jgi:pimeloyl-ACP methyl ester carboxylesterase
MAIPECASKEYANPMSHSPNESDIAQGILARPNETIRLADGRLLGFAQFGPELGAPVYYFHGWPGSRLEAGFFSIPDVLMIGVDRPGYGLSDPSPKRGLMDWPGDIVALADKLGHEHFAVVGMSGGGPYAAACAYALPDRVTGTAILAGLGPPEAPGMQNQRLGFLLGLGRRPIGSTIALAALRTLVRSRVADRRIAFLRDRLPADSNDRNALTPKMLQMLLTSFREGLRASSQGVKSDARIYGEPWPFKLSGIRTPVKIWHGRKDVQVPVSVGEFYHANIPGAQAEFPEHDGHFSIVLDRLNAVIAGLRSA